MTTMNRMQDENGTKDDEVLDLINRAIREHELRVALWSGLLGAALTAGTWHAIWLCRS